MDHFQYQILITTSSMSLKHGEAVDDPSVKIYVNKIESRVTFKIKN